MSPTLQNGGLLCLAVFVVSFLICLLAARRIEARWKFYAGYTLVAAFAIAFIPEPADARYADDIDARVSFLIVQAIAFLALLFGVLLGTTGRKHKESVHST